MSEISDEEIEKNLSEEDKTKLLLILEKLKEGLEKLNEKI